MVSKNGKGIFYYAKGTKKYDGFYANDKYEGIGKIIYEDEGDYTGEFKNGLRHGKGILNYKLGNIKLEGNFVNGEFIK